MSSCLLSVLPIYSVTKNFVKNIVPICSIHILEVPCSINETKLTVKWAHCRIVAEGKFLLERTSDSDYFLWGRIAVAAIVADRFLILNHSESKYRTLSYNNKLCETHLEYVCSLYRKTFSDFYPNPRTGWAWWFKIVILLSVNNTTMMDFNRGIDDANSVVCTFPYC